MLAVFAPVSAETDIRVPDKLGKVLESFRGLSGKSVIFIQDAHANYDAQNSIRGLIDYFQKKRDIRLVGLEGGEGVLDLSVLRAFPDQKVKADVLNEYVRRGELTGAEMAAVVNELPAEYVGLEDAGLYRENKKAFLAVLENRYRFEREARKIRAALDQVSDQVDCPELRELRSHPSETLARLAKDLKLDPKKITNYNQFIQDVKEKLFRSPEERALDRKFRYLEALERISRLEATREDVLFSAALLKEFKIDLKSALRFYDLAFRRDQVLAENFLKHLTGDPRPETSILITGGFHAEGIKVRLKQAGISYILIQPKIQNVGSDELYLKAMRGEASYARPRNLEKEIASAGDDDAKILMRRKLQEWRMRVSSAPVQILPILDRALGIAALSPGIKTFDNSDRQKFLDAAGLQFLIRTAQTVKPNITITDVADALTRAASLGAKMVPAFEQIEKRIKNLKTLRRNFSESKLPEMIYFGDKHGVSEDLERIVRLARSAHTNKTQIHIVGHGDGFDRGSDNVGVWSAFRRLLSLAKSDPNVRVDLLFGNHDFVFILRQILLSGSNVKNDWLLFFGGLAVQNEFEKKFGAEAESKLDELAFWMLEHFKLYELDEAGILHVHAGIPVDGEGSPRVSLEQLVNWQNKLEFYQKKFSTRKGVPGKRKFLLERSPNGKTHGEHLTQFIYEIESIVTGRSTKYISNIRRFLAQLGVNAIVVGHTRTPDIVIRGERIFMIDVGIPDNVSHLVFDREGFALDTVGASKRTLISRKDFLKSLDDEIKQLQGGTAKSLGDADNDSQKKNGREILRIRDEIWKKNLESGDLESFIDYAGLTDAVQRTVSDQRLQTMGDIVGNFIDQPGALQMLRDLAQFMANQERKGLPLQPHPDILDAAYSNAQTEVIKKFQIAAKDEMTEAFNQLGAGADQTLQQIKINRFLLGRKISNDRNTPVFIFEKISSGRILVKRNPGFFDPTISEHYMEAYRALLSLIVQEDERLGKFLLSKRNAVKYLDFFALSDFQYFITQEYPDFVERFGTGERLFEELFSASFRNVRAYLKAAYNFELHSKDSDERRLAHEILKQKRKFAIREKLVRKNHPRAVLMANATPERIVSIQTAGSQDWANPNVMILDNVGYQVVRGQAIPGRQGEYYPGEKVVLARWKNKFFVFYSSRSHTVQGCQIHQWRSSDLFYHGRQFLKNPYAENLDDARGKLCVMLDKAIYDRRLVEFQPPERFPEFSAKSAEINRALNEGPDKYTIFRAAKAAAKSLGEVTSSLGETEFDWANPSAYVPVRSLNFNDAVTAFAFNPNQKNFAVGDSKKNIWLYDWKTGALIREFHATGEIRAIGFSFDGNVIAITVTDAVQVIDLRTGETKPFPLENKEDVLAGLSAGGKCLAITSFRSGVKVLKIETGKTVWETERVGKTSAVCAFPSSDGQYILTFAKKNKSIQVKVRNFETGKVIHEYVFRMGKSAEILPIELDEVNSVDISSDSKLGLVESPFGSVHIFDLKHGNLLKEAIFFRDSGRVLFTPDGQGLLLSGNQLGQPASVWKLTEAKAAHSIFRNLGKVDQRVSFSSDGAYVLASTSPKTVVLAAIKPRAVQGRSLGADEKVERLVTMLRAERIESKDLRRFIDTDLTPVSDEGAQKTFSSENARIRNIILAGVGLNGVTEPGLRTLLEQVFKTVSFLEEDSWLIRPVPRPPKTFRAEEEPVSPVAQPELSGEFNARLTTKSGAVYASVAEEGFSAPFKAGKMVFAVRSVKMEKRTPRYFLSILGDEHSERVGGVQISIELKFKKPVEVGRDTFPVLKDSGLAPRHFSALIDLIDGRPYLLVISLSEQNPVLYPREQFKARSLGQDDALQKRARDLMEQPGDEALLERTMVYVNQHDGLNGLRRLRGFFLEASAEAKPESALSKSGWSQLIIKAIDLEIARRSFYWGWMESPHALLPPHEKFVCKIVMSSDRNWAVSIDRDGTIQRINLSENTSRGFLKTSPHLEDYINLSPDLTKAVSGSLAFRVPFQLLDLQNPSNPPAILEGFKENMVEALVSPDGSNLVAWFSDGAIRKWDLENPGTSPTLFGGTASRRLPHKIGIRGVQFSPDGSRLAVWDSEGRIRIFDVHHPKRHPLIFRPRKNGIIQIVFDRDSRNFLSWADDGTFSLYDSEKRKTIRVHYGNEKRMAHGVVGSGWNRALSWLGQTGSNYNLQLWDLTDEKTKPFALKGHHRTIIGAVMSADEKRALSWDENGTALFWDLENKKVLGIFPRQYGLVIEARLSPDGDRALTWSRGGKLIFWDLKTMQILAATGNVTAYETDPDWSRILYADTASRSVRIIQAQEKSKIESKLCVQYEISHEDVSAILKSISKEKIQEWNNRFRSATLADREGKIREKLREIVSEIRETVVLACPEIRNRINGWQLASLIFVVSGNEDIESRSIAEARSLGEESVPSARDFLAFTDVKDWVGEEMWKVFTSVNGAPPRVLHLAGTVDDLAENTGPMSLKQNLAKIPDNKFVLLIMHNQFREHELRHVIAFDLAKELKQPDKLATLLYAEPFLGQFEFLLLLSAKDKASLSGKNTLWLHRISFGKDFIPPSLRGQGIVSGTFQKIAGILEKQYPAWTIAASAYHVGLAKWFSEKFDARLTVEEGVDAKKKFQPFLNPSDPSDLKYFLEQIKKNEQLWKMKMVSMDTPLPLTGKVKGKPRKDFQKLSVYLESVRGVLEAVIAPFRHRNAPFHDAEKIKLFFALRAAEHEIDFLRIMPVDVRKMVEDLEIYQKVQGLIREARNFL
ncbi:MAG: metallophosphoesterase, partial [Candidatus Omnitrophica bacterium]|nr:metallophosphoesterase [Candidatus Omnitrophota bacterium]